MIKLRPLLTEEVHDTFMAVDIQPEYQGSFKYFLPKFIQYLNANEGKINHIVFLYNGKDTMGMISEDDYRSWLTENGLDDWVLDRIAFYDKGYAFFRYCMDEGMDGDTVANFVRFMYENDVHDSRDMTRDMWAKYLREYRRSDKKTVFDLLEKNDDCINIPELMDFLKRYNNITIAGGAVEQCLAEVEIALQALRKKYRVLDEFTYW